MDRGQRTPENMCCPATAGFIGHADGARKAHPAEYLSLLLVSNTSVHCCRSHVTPLTNMQKLQDMPTARVKRILANRQSAARSKERKLAYIGELESQVWFCVQSQSGLKVGSKMLRHKLRHTSRAHLHRRAGTAALVPGCTWKTHLPSALTWNTNICCTESTSQRKVNAVLKACQFEPVQVSTLTMQLTQASVQLRSLQQDTTSLGARSRLAASPVHCQANCTVPSFIQSVAGSDI